MSPNIAYYEIYSVGRSDKVTLSQAELTLSLQRLFPRRVKYFERTRLADNLLTESELI